MHQKRCICCCIVVTFSIDKAWKGIPSDRSEVVLITRLHSESCGYPFEAGKSYLVYSYSGSADNSSFGVSLCSSTKPIADADADLAVLGAGYYVPIKQPVTPAMLTECRALEIEDERCSEGAILTAKCIGGTCAYTPKTQEGQLQDPAMLSMFGLLAAGIGGAAAVFYVKSRKGKKETGQ